jgi:drug/metabolite transporter (DMT)-like permease
MLSHSGRFPAKHFSASQSSAATCGLLLTTPLFFASNILAARLVQRAAVPPVFLAFSRWTLALVVLLPLIGRRLWIARAQVRELFWNFVLLGGIGMGLAVAPQYIGARSTSATNVAMILSCAPILVVILESARRREMPGAATLAGIAMALLGILVILGRGDPRAVLDVTFGSGDLWILLADVGWAVYTVLLKRMPLPRVDSLSRMALLMFGATVTLAPCCVFEAAGGRVPAFNGVTVAAVAFLAIIPGIFGYTGYACLIARAGETTASMSCYLIPFYTAILAWPILGEMPRTYHLAGIGLILSGLWFTTVTRREAAGGVLPATLRLPARHGLTVLMLEE